MRTRTARPILGLTLREHIGGRWAISLLAYALNAPINIALTFAGSLGAAAGWGPALSLAVLGYLAFGAVALLADVTVFRHRRQQPVPIWAVVALGALAGLMRGVVIAAAGMWLTQAPDDALTLARLITSTTLGAALVPASALLLSVIDRYRTQRRALIDEAARLRAEAMREDGASDAIRAALLASVQTDLEELARTGDAQQAREVGRQVWVGEVAPQATRLRWGSVIGASIARNPFPTVPVVLIWALSATPNLVAILGVTTAAAQVLTSCVVIAVGFALGRRWMATGGGVLAFVSVMGLLVVLTGPVASVIFDPRSWPAGAGLVIANSVWLPLLTIGIGIVVTAVRASESVLDALTQDVDEGEVAVIAAHEETSRLRRELAAQLHGTVHSRLLAATALTSQVDIRDAARDAIASTMHASTEDARGLEERVTEVVSVWSALMTVTLEIGDIDAAKSRLRAEPVARVIEEGLSNAYRHGKAEHASVTLFDIGDDLHMRIDDDGRWTDRESPGMGSALFTAVSRGRWDRTPLPEGGSRLEILIP